ncbi:glutamate ABC transporter substrate-binding protein [Streptomyces sp. ID05-26A]|nr:glutamate ABC transporter substrate-binding protein [Streptomyces sp. ID05-26A]
MRTRKLVAVAAALCLLTSCGQAVTVPARTTLEPLRPPGMDDTRGALAPTQCPPGTGPDFVPERSSLKPLGRSPAQAPPGSTLAEIVRRGRLVAGVDQNLNRSSSLNPRTGALEGFDVDVVKTIAKELFGDENAVTLVEVNFSNNFPKLAAEDVDLLADSITITCERRFTKKVMFSSDYFISGQRVLVPKASGVKSIGDLKGKRVCAPNGTTSMGKLKEPSLGVVPVGVREFPDCLVLMQRGQVEASSTTDSVLLGLKDLDPATDIVGERFSEEHHGLAMRESDEELVRFVNGVLERMRADGTWKRLYEKWLRDPDEPGPVPEPPPAHYIDEE